MARRVCPPNIGLRVRSDRVSFVFVCDLSLRSSLITPTSTTMSEESGPSQIPENSERRKSYNLRDEFHEATQTQKRHKITDVSEIFQRPDAEEQKRLNKEYRTLQSEADGEGLII